MHHETFLQDLAIVMMVAGVVTLLFHRLKQPVVLGYILAGVIIGPHTPPFPFVGSPATIQTLSELGIIFLMFALGLEFSLGKLREVGATAVVAATLEIAVMIGVGYGIGRFFGWSFMDSLFLGAILSISSTTIIVKALEELGLVKQRFARLVFGVLIVEDMLGIVLIALLSGLAKTGSLFTREAAGSLGLLAVFLVSSLVIGLIAVPRILGFAARFRSSEMLLVTVLALCFGFTLLTVKLGFSVALGAFLIGAIVAESREHGRIEELLMPVRDMFSAVFFVSVGLLIDPALLLEHAVPIAVISFAVVAGKVVTCSLGAFLAGNDMRTSTRVGMSLSQIGEFSFIIAALGLSLGVTSGFLYPIAVSVSAITTFTTPWLIRSSDGFTAWIERRTPPKALSLLGLYKRWLDQIAVRRQDSQVRRILRRIFVQLATFLGLIAGALLAAVALSRLILGFIPAAEGWADIIHSALWLLAVLSVMPIYIAAYRKLKALGMILAELGVSDAFEFKSEIRAVAANTILVLGLAAIALFTFALSYAMLPPGPFLAAILVVTALLAYLLRTAFNTVYFQGKAALAQTLGEAPAATQVAEVPITPGLHEARLEMLQLAPWMAGTGKSLRELELKTRTGALVVGIERGDQEIVNPDADETLLAGDRLLLLGKKTHIAGALELLSGSLPPGGARTH
jgi:CPA2 family monovalent cation:H+ antiporter-2